MDKITFYENTIYKSAMARAWKKAVGGLDDVNYHRLISSGILNHEKELAGLNKGTEAIISHKGGVVVRPDISSEQFAKHFVENKAKGSDYMKDYMRVNGVTKEQIARQLAESRDISGGYMSGAFTGGGGVVSKGNIQNLNKSLKDIFHAKITPFENPLDRKYADAIMNRHEANELGTAHNLMKNKKNSLAYKNERVSMANTDGHNSPKVIVHESGHVAIAPKATKDYMRAMREVTNEIKNYKDNGFDYGVSGVYNKNTGKKLERKAVNANRKDFKETLDYFKNN